MDTQFEGFRKIVRKNKTAETRFCRVFGLFVISVEPREEPEPEPHVALTTSKKKICGAMVSSLTWKAGIVFSLIVALIVVVIILNFTVLREDSSGEDPLPTIQATKPRTKPSMNT